MSVLREVAAVIAALGLLALLLAPAGMRRSEAFRGAGLAAAVLGAVLILVSLIPGDDLRAGLERLGSPAAGGAAAVGLAALVAAMVVGVRVVVARPVVWFVLLALALPIRVPVSLGSQDANLLLPLYLVIALGVFAWLWARVSGRVPAAGTGPRALAWPLAAFVALTVVSAVWSSDPEEAGIKLACFYIPFAILYALVLAWWPHAQALRALVIVTLAGGVVAATMALWQFYSGDLWWNATLQQANVYSRFFRVNGFFFDPNILGRYLALGILVAVAVAWVRRGNRDLALLGGAAAIMAAGLFVTYSRSSTLMLMLGLALLGARAVGARRALGVAAALLIVIGGITLAASGNVREAATDLDRLERVSEGRFDLMRGGLTIWRDDPVLGTGVGGFAREFADNLTDTERARIRVVISHNTPVTVLSEVGLVGFALFLWLLVGAGWSVVRGSRAQGGDAGWARWTAGAILLGIVVHSLFYAALFEDPFVWVLGAGACALAALPSQAGTGDRDQEA
ncbi:MAG: O-antigen ligase family protein, partial [Miltoncostaeaceae bacterium]